MNNVVGKWKLDYIGVILLWIVIFWGNWFSNLLFVDYVQANEHFIVKKLVTSNFVSSVSLLDLLKVGFAYLGIESVFFTFAILLGMLLSYFYIKKLIGKGEFSFRVLLFALIFFFNPFVYTKIMIGQLGILIAYLLMPMFLFYLFGMFRELDVKNVMKTVLVMWTIGSMTPHFFVICFLTFLIGLFWLGFYKNEFNVNKYGKMLGVFLVLSLLLNAYWLQGVFVNPTIDAIDESHESFFAPKASSGISAIAKILGMWGFWRENAFISTYGVIPIRLWYLAVAILVVLMIVGYYSNNESKKSKFFYTLFWFGLLLGVGISHPYTGKIFDVLFEYLPFFNGFRDSHKFVSLIALAYAYFVPLGIEAIGNRWRKNYRRVLTLFLVLFIFAYTFPLIGLWGQARNLDYPQEYYQVNEFLDSKEINGKIIYLPWEGYLSYNWSLGISDGRIGVFANELMNKEIIEGPDEYGGRDEFRIDVEKCLGIMEENCFKEIGVEYVLHDNCVIYPEKYLWLESEVESKGCVDIYYIGGVSEKSKTPGRFILGLVISIITLLGIVFVLGNELLNKR